ncbi:HAD domain-containing protein [Candidatus Uabimicrobium sp. HlEnr_7]|uniref:HAD domain-containing protein n=1 Tax=Candidatus Uabimicrobium helgolandensis TaxID=3095367 RepID=UPI0035590227
MTKKILFLDIDGVLNFESMQPIMDCFSAPNAGFHGIHMIDPQKVEILNLIVSRSECEVVVCSTWRQKFNLVELNEMLTNRGFNGIVRDTTTLPFQKEGIWSKKGDEVGVWLKSNFDISAFVIIDDDDEFSLFRNFHVKTDFRVGLTNKDAEKAISILTR